MKLKPCLKEWQIASSSWTVSTMLAGIENFMHAKVLVHEAFINHYFVPVNTPKTKNCLKNFTSIINNAAKSWNGSKTWYLSSNAESVTIPRRIVGFYEEAEDSNIINECMCGYNRRSGKKCLLKINFENWKNSVATSFSYRKNACMYYKKCFRYSNNYCFP